jgi:ATP-dependent Clp protease ATP-binding subunit ClpA
VYPFERFAQDAKQALTYAQEEAERSHHSYIGTEHMLLGLMRLPEGHAREVLRELDIDVKAVRDTIAAVVGRNERIVIQQIIPTSRVKMVIEIAFEEARRMGHDRVDSGHMLMALVIEGEGIAAHVLDDLGATAQKVVAALERRWKVEPSGRGKRPQTRARFPFPARMRLREMRTLAGLSQVPPPSSEVETLHRLLATPHIAAALRARGLDVDSLARLLLNPPEAVLKLRRQLAEARDVLADAVAQTDYERAGQAQKTVVRLAGRLRGAEEAWLRTLGS